MIGGVIPALPTFFKADYSYDPARKSEAVDITLLVDLLAFLALAVAWVVLPDGQAPARAARRPAPSASST
jgi:hypothetical protein